MLQNIKFNTKGKAKISIMEYRATVERTKDGDTAVFAFDLGLGASISQEKNDNASRFLFVHALEKTQHRKQTPEEKELGLKAWDIAKKYLPKGKEVILQTAVNDNSDVYGRYLVKIFIPELGNEKSLNEYLLEEYGSPMFLTAEQDDEMIKKREERLGVEIRKRVSR